MRKRLVLLIGILGLFFLVGCSEHYTNYFYDVYEFEDYNITFYKKCRTCEWKLSTNGLPLKECNNCEVHTVFMFYQSYKCDKATADN